MRRHLLLLLAAVVAGAAALSALYLGLRHDLAPLPLAEATAVVALMLTVSAALAAALTDRHYRRTLRDLGACVADFRATPSGGPLAERLRPTGGGPEWAPLLTGVEALADAYRQALGEVVRTQEVLEKFRSFAGMADGDKAGHSSAKGPSSFFRSTRLIARLAPNLHWVAATAALQRFLGRPLAALSARSFLECVHPDDAPRLLRPFQEALREGEAHDITFRVMTKGGDARYVQMDVLTRYDVDGGPLHLRCHFVDVTDRVAAERELRLQSARLAQANALLRQTNAGLERLKESYRDLYHQAPVLYFSLDTNGRFAACNDTLLAALGYTREDLQGRPYTRLLTSEGARRFLQDPGAYARSGEIETRWVKKDGSAIDVWVRTAPVLDEHGDFVRSRSAALEVTERNRLANAVRAKAEELQHANERLRRINGELEEFTRVVSHDLKEPLRTLEAFSSFLQQDYGQALGGDGADYISHLVAASRRLGRLIDDLLALSRAGKVINTPAAFDLGEAARVVTADLSDLIHRTGAEVRVEGKLPRVTGDRERVTQLLANLIANGLKYNRSSPPVVVIGVVDGGQWIVDSEKSASPSAAHRPPSAAPSTVHRPPSTIFVRDNGIGIASQYHEDIFRLFRRLHRREEYEGTGAGLAICKKIVEAHGGRIWVESEAGRGATFYFTLPSAAPPVPVLEARDNGHGPRENGQGANGHAAPAAR
jgi:PAS domain S-box-containing protein